MTSIKHVASLREGHLEFQNAFGSISRLCSGNMPILKRLSIKRLLLAANAMREPHWHANASELSYCVSGNVLVSVLDSGSVLSSFTIGPGQMFHIPSGSIHHIENLGAEPAELIIAFRHEKPEDFSMHAAFGAMTDAVLGNTYDLTASAFAPLRRSTEGALIVERSVPASVPAIAAFNNPHKFDIEAQHPLLSSLAGSARFARDQFWPALKNISMYSLRISDTGMRKPHWHPETAEMGYVARGRARMTVLDPDGSTDTYDLRSGDV
jgi:oxalate decarboxylase